MWFSRVRNKAEKNKSSSGIEKYLAMWRSLIRGPGCSIIWAPRANSIGTMKTPGWTGFLPVAQDISSNAPGRKKMPVNETKLRYANQPVRAFAAGETNAHKKAGCLLRQSNILPGFISTRDVACQTSKTRCLREH